MFEILTDIYNDECKLADIAQLDESEDCRPGLFRLIYDKNDNPFGVHFVEGTLLVVNDIRLGNDIFVAEYNKNLSSWDIQKQFNDIKLSTLVMIANRLKNYMM